MKIWKSDVPAQRIIEWLCYWFRRRRDADHVIPRANIPDADKPPTY